MIVGGSHLVCGHLNSLNLNFSSECFIFSKLTFFRGTDVAFDTSVRMAFINQ